MAGQSKIGGRPTTFSLPSSIRIDGPRGGELGFLFVFKTLMQNLNKFNLHNSKSPNSRNTS
jgi:hypothetical protein